MFTKVCAYQHRGKFYKMKNKADIHHCDLRELADSTKHSVWTWLMHSDSYATLNE